LKNFYHLRCQLGEKGFRKQREKKRKILKLFYFPRRKSRRLSENNEILLNNTVKYRKKLQTAITQINRTKKSVQRNLDNPDSEIHVARLINDIGQLSDYKPLQVFCTRK
jgi:hypothetical protein